MEVTWSIYQRMITAYRDPDRACGKRILRGLIDSISSGVPASLIEVTTLGRTLKRRAVDVLAFFDRPGTSNGPSEAIRGRLEHLRGSALGFRNLSTYIARSPLECGGFRPLLHSGLRWARLIPRHPLVPSTTRRAILRRRWIHAGTASTATDGLRRQGLPR